RCGNAGIVAVPVDGEAEVDALCGQHHLAGQAETMETVPIDAAAFSIAHDVGRNGLRNGACHSGYALEFGQGFGLFEVVAGQDVSVPVCHFGCSTDHGLVVIDCGTGPTRQLARHHFLDTRPAYVAAFRGSGQV